MRKRPRPEPAEPSTSSAVHEEEPRFCLELKEEKQPARPLPALITSAGRSDDLGISMSVIEGLLR